MKKLLFLALLLIAPKLYSQTCTAASTSSTDVQTALTACASGGTVIIPAGTSTWSSIVSINPTGPLNIIGASPCTAGCAAGSGGTGLAFTDSTNITLNNTNGAFQITGCSAAVLCTISNITFINGQAAAHGQLQISGTHAQVSFRAHHLHFTDTLGTGGVLFTTNNGYGLIDHDLCTVTNSTGQSTCLNMGGDFPTGGTLNWQDATVLGSNQAIIVEDSVFNGPAACASVSNSCTEGVFDAYYGAKVVIRNSIVNNWNPGGGHGSDTAYWRSMVTGEFYNLTINSCSSVGSGNGLMNTRGGVFLFHDNVVTGNCNSINQQYLRQAINPNASQWGIIGPGLNWSWTALNGAGLAPLTLNAADWQASHSYASGAVVGPTSNNAGAFNYQAAGACTSGGSRPSPFNQTYNANTTDNTCTWKNVGGTTAAGAGASGWLSTAPDTTCTSGVNCTYFADNTGGTAPFRDMVGIGHNQVVMPNYAWNNSGAGLPSPVLSTSQTSIIVSGTNYFNTTAMPGYTPYAYPDPLQITTWYIRPDGGTRWTAANSTGQCDGKGDNAYPGSGVNQHCAFNDDRWLWDDQTFGNFPNWAISGGDTVILRKNTAGAPWRVGFTGNGATTDPWCFGGGGPFGCIMPAIPSGTAANHTRFLGENFGACQTTRTIMTVNGPRVQQIPDVSKTTKIFGGHGVFLTVNAAGSQYVDIQCLDISSFQPACQLQGSPNTNPCNTTVGSLSDYASDALTTSNTSGNLLLQDIYIHGMNSRGIHGQQGTGPVTANRLWISIIPQTGWDFDDGTASGTAPWSLTNSIIEASGCQQLNSPPNYPSLNDAQLWQDIGVCYSQGSGAVIGDGIGTPPSSGFNVTMDSDIFQWNTQDGEDFGHMDTGSFSFTLTNTVSQHNSGQTFKNGWAFNDVKYLNNIALADCDRMNAGNQLPGGVPLTVNQFVVDGCRAGDNLSVNFQRATQFLFANNTVVGYQPTFFDYKCVDGSNDCSAAVWTINNNIMVAFDNPAAVGQPPADYCGPSCNGGSGLIGTANRKNNIYFNMRNCHANVQTPDVNAGTSTGESCTSPLFVSQPASPMSTFSDLDGFNYNLTASSPAIGGGVTYTGLLSTDYAGSTQTSPPVIGALIFGTAAPPTGVGITSNVKITASVKIQ